MKATIERQTDDIGVERGRRLVLLAFSPDHQRMRSPGDVSPLIKRVTTADRSHLGGFHSTRCHAPSQKTPKHSQPVFGRTEGVGDILREIRSLPAIHQLWLHFMYGTVRKPALQRRLQQLHFAIYRSQCGLLNADTLHSIEIMIGEHIRYLSGMDIPPVTVSSRRDACHELRNICDDAWKRTYVRHWKRSYRMILAVDELALMRVDKSVL